MKMLTRITGALAVIVLFTACTFRTGDQHSSKKESEGSGPDINGFYGEPFETAHAIPAYEIPEKLADTNNTELTVEGKVLDVCQVSGCWLEMDMMNGETIFVTFKNEDFVVPKDCKGKTVTVKGFVTKEVIGVDILKKMAREEGLTQEDIDAIDQPREEFSFVASGLIFPED